MLSNTNIIFSVYLSPRFMWWRPIYDIYVLNFILFYFIILYFFYCNLWLLFRAMHSSIVILTVAFIPPCEGIKFCVAWKNISFIQICCGFPVVELAKKTYLYIFVAFICQKLFIHNGAGGHFGFTPLEKNAGIFARDTGAKFFLKGSRKSNQSSNQKVVMKVRFFTLLFFW